VDLSVRDPSRKKDYMGSDEEWALAEGALERVVKASGLAYHRAVGEAVFYGPEIDISSPTRSDGAGSAPPSSSISTCPAGST